MQGFGNVGSWAARLMQELGATLVGVSDASGAIADEGASTPRARGARARGRHVADFDGSTDEIDPDDLLASNATSSSPPRSGE